MAVSKIIDRLTLGTWLKTSIDGLNSCYVIAIKGKKSKNDEIDPNNIVRVSFELGIDCGIKNKPLTIGRVNVNFKDIITTDSELNGIVASALASKIPSEFYIRAVSILTTDMREIKEGSVNISVNVNPLKLD